MDLTTTHGRSGPAALGDASTYSLRGWVDGPSCLVSERTHIGSMSRLWPLPGLNRRSTLPCDAAPLPVAGGLLDGTFCGYLSDISECASTCGDADEAASCAAFAHIDDQRRYLHQPITAGASSLPEWSQTTPTFHSAAMAAPTMRGRQPWKELGRRLSLSAVPGNAHRRISTTTRHLARSISAPFGLGVPNDQPVPGNKRRKSWLGSIGRRLRGCPHEHFDAAAVPIMAQRSSLDDGDLAGDWDDASVSSQCAPASEPVPTYPRLRSQPPQHRTVGAHDGVALAQDNGRWTLTPPRWSVPRERRGRRFFLA